MAGQSVGDRPRCVKIQSGTWCRLLRPAAPPPIRDQDPAAESRKIRVVTVGKGSRGWFRASRAVRIIEVDWGDCGAGRPSGGPTIAETASSFALSADRRVVMKVDAERQLVYFTGQVQGVGFRYTARRVATRYAVAGFVRNVADGRVELVAEGIPSELGAFVDDLRKTMEPYVQHCDIHRGPASGEFDGFEIRF